MMNDLKGKKFLVTGASSGIGRETAKILVQMGSIVVGLDKDEYELEITNQMCGGNLSKISFDLKNLDALYPTIQNVVDKIGKLDGVVNSAGVSYICPLKNINYQKLEEVVKINTYSAIELSKIFSRSGINNKGGSIVFISSIFGLVGTQVNSGYSISKSALHGLTKSLSIELASRKIRVNCVAPGFVKTEMMYKTSEIMGDNYIENLNKLHPLGLGEVDDVANCVIFLLSNSSKWITGNIIKVDGGYTSQ